MTRMVNKSDDFVAEALEGFALANQDRVLQVPGAGIVRATQTPPGQVAVVTGGGSGHFPGFSGFVGPGFLHGAVCGNIFSSPSEAQILAVTKAAIGTGGVVFAPINYSGDILHFGGAAETLRGAGIGVRMQSITDDIISGTSDKYLERRGIAGAFVVLKITGAAAEANMSLDEVERVLVKANDATRTFGVAFGACTLPGAEAPLFVVPEGQMAVGLGIHGEPGIDEVPVTTADQATDLLVDGLFQERAPQAGQRVAVLVNGLGATKYDELSIVFRRVAQRLAEVGMVYVAPVVGEQVTSLDMEGFSVTFTYLDDELEQLWLAPTHISSFARGQIGIVGPRRTVTSSVKIMAADFVSGSAVSQQLAQVLVEIAGKVAEVMTANEAMLGDMDAVAGDGDHGVGMSKGARAATEAAAKASASGAGAGSVLVAAGHAWSDIAGGTSGALWGAGLVAAGQVLGDETELTPLALGAAVEAFRDAVLTRGGATVGDKTVVDALVPFVDALNTGLANGDDMVVAWSDAATVAAEAARGTAAFGSKRGRSRLHGDRSIGTPDPGAMSFAMVTQAAV